MSRALLGGVRMTGGGSATTAPGANSAGPGTETPLRPGGGPSPSPLHQLRAPPSQRREPPASAREQQLYLRDGGGYQISQQTTPPIAPAKGTSDCLFCSSYAKNTP